MSYSHRSHRAKSKKKAGHRKARALAARIAREADEDSRSMASTPRPPSTETQSERDSAAPSSKTRRRVP